MVRGEYHTKQYRIHIHCSTVFGNRTLKSHGAGKPGSASDRSLKLLDLADVRCNVQPDRRFIQ
jgi:hypothetical protein